MIALHLIVNIVQDKNIGDHLYIKHKSQKGHDDTRFTPDYNKITPTDMKNKEI